MKYILGSHLFVHGIAATPTPLLEGLCEHVKANNFGKITLHHMHLEGRTPWLAPDVKGQHFLPFFFCTLIVTFFLTFSLLLLGLFVQTIAL